ncbi:fibrinogen-like protein 1 [Cyprinus carpio]|uniref:Fibrinogen-like protein 1 n=1 Tax=Cyprinus carpio TaxID=7962 RepID=A0A9R0AP65_CYPCA|nr:fibrinogen-like protein 1 [Cyprinus carpio]
MKFSTVDKDQDALSGNCAMTNSQGGFWYNGCAYANPTGLYLWGKDDGNIYIGVYWYYWKGSYKSLKSISMKIRRVK